MKTKKGETGILSFGLHLASLLCLFLVTDVIVSIHIYTSTVNPHELTLSMNIYIYISQVVRFSSIKYSRKFEISDNGYETFGNKVVGCFIGPLRTLFGEKNSIWLQVLKGVDGYIMPGSMTLLLGPPGKITLT